MRLCDDSPAAKLEILSVVHMGLKKGDARLVARLINQHDWIVPFFAIPEDGPPVIRGEKALLDFIRDLFVERGEDQIKAAEAEGSGEPGAARKDAAVKRLF